jgi:putative tricarboxylic transport membrane protein
MTPGQLKSITPYVVGLALAGALYVYTGHIDFTPRPGQLGPDVWPRMAIALMAAACAFEIVRRLVVGATLTRGVVDMLEQSDAAQEEEEPTHPALLAGGVALLAAYALAVNTLGFLLATFLFIVAFMYLGRYRNHAAIWSISIAATFLIAFLFLRVAYVSLPRGAPPFDRFTDLIRLIVG